MAARSAPSSSSWSWSWRSWLYGLSGLAGPQCRPAFRGGESRRVPALTLAGTGEFLPNTLLASFDPAFYNPSSLSGSALTRRLVRVYYPGVSSLELRVMTVSIESQYSKTEIMESYINQAPMSGGPQPVKGLAAASTFYFGKPFAQLTPQDIALLVALMNNPQGLDPRSVPEKAYDARNLVLQADLQQNVLSQAQVDNLSKMPLAWCRCLPRTRLRLPPLQHPSPLLTDGAAGLRPASCMISRISSAAKDRWRGT